MKYAVHSTVRGRHNRTQRAAAPMHHRFCQTVGADQQRLIRGRPLLITEDKLLRDLEELRAKEKKGILEVRTLDGRKFDLATLSPAPVAPPIPQPNPPLDSISRDQPSGIPMSSVPGGKPIDSLPAYSEEEEIPPVVVDEEVKIPADFMPAKSKGGKGKDKS